jgi:hypothetical protein
MPGQVAAYSHFGITLKNDRWSWSGRTPDGSRVILTLWKDEIDYSSKPPMCNYFGHPKLSQWLNRAGNHERIENLKWARDHCGGLFGIVIATAVDVSAEPRKIADAYPTTLRMRLVEFNEETGEFSAELVERNV